MNITLDKTHLEAALNGINNTFRDKILDDYIDLKKRQLRSYYNDEYDSVGLTSGKLCETILRFLQKELTNNFTPFDKHITNFQQEINNITQTSVTSGCESLRVIIPRGLFFVYTLRNKRGIGHIGGDVVANQIDISTIVKIIDWIICELIRIYHSLTLDQAQKLVDSLNMKILPDIWSVDGKKRILRSNLTASERVLMILYSEIDNQAELKQLFEWVEYSNLSMFKKNVLIPLHKDKKIEYDIKKSDLIKISPLGSNFVESNLYKGEIKIN